MEPQSSERQRPDAPRRAFLAGVGAALMMTAAMAVLRATTGTPSLPEILGEAIVSLMPASVFSTILDAMQKAAKPTLFAGIFVGMLAVGGLLGKGFAYGDLTWRRALTLAAVVWAAFGLVILPLLGVGLFGAGAVRAGMTTLAIQLALVVGTFAGALLLLLRAAEPGRAGTGRQRARRAALAGLAGWLVVLGSAGRRGARCWWAAARRARRAWSRPARPSRRRRRTRRRPVHRRHHRRRRRPRPKARHPPRPLPRRTRARRRLRAGACPGSTRHPSR